ncbi:UbiD family decarboxylase, partial [Chloroflexota bacterium]
KEGIKLIPPVEVTSGPVKENVLVGKDVDLLKFPTPKWHELDGGRYIGTGCMIILRDPDEGWINLSVQRAQVHSKSIATIHMSPGKDSILIREKYLKRGLSCPVAISCGQDPLLWSIAARRAPWGVSEYDCAGGVMGKPVEITRGVTTDLPVPATAEIVLEGEIVPPEVESIQEGPFGEWWGVYVHEPGLDPVIRIKSILHRNNPIIQGNPCSVLPPLGNLGLHIQKAAILWLELDRKVSGVKGVWMLDDAACQSIPVISIKQENVGHSHIAAMVAASCPDIVEWAASRFIIVVDDDIDPSNKDEVLWALSNRVDPETSIEIIRGYRSTRSDPRLSPDKRKRGELSHSKAIINACKPYHWIKEFPITCKASPERLKKTKEKWANIFP